MPRGKRRITGATLGDGDLLEAALVGFEAKRSEIERKIEELRQRLGRGTGEQGGTASKDSPQPIARKRRTLSAAARKRIGAAQRRRRWAEVQKATGQKPKSRAGSPPKRKLSAAARKRIGEATRKRWAEFRAKKAAGAKAGRNKAGAKMRSSLIHGL